MAFTIKRLTPDLISDYMDFFDNRAFSDGSPFYPCYCCNYNMPDDEFWAHCEGLEDTTENRCRVQRDCAEILIKDGRLQGYLIYDGEISIGWCNANNKKSYRHFGDFNMDDDPKDAAIASDSPGKTKSAVCFEVAPDYRRRGVATMLLKRVIEDARNEGYDFVEIYPSAQKEFNFLQYTGPMGLCEKLGFERTAQHGNTVVMRKKLKF
ncbi:MAG: GNAT family N-acetyltransferase [Oscillospiraceae bacterium]|nr:GNAT family N-acetyltransferase [Oscillospiraceae bacterium]